MGGPESLFIAGGALALAGLLFETARLRRRHQQHATDGRVFLHVTFEIKPANVGAFFAAFKPLLAASLKESGCIKYQLTREKEGAPHTYVLIEEWSSAECLSRHETLPHFTTAVPQMAKCANIRVHKYETVNLANM
jgi:quinol monooxygenase YgiN